MKILYIGFDIEGVGGIATYSRHQIRALRDLGHPTLVVSLDKQDAVRRIGGGIADLHIPFLDKYQASREVLRFLFAHRRRFELVALNHVYLAGYGLAYRLISSAPYLLNVYNIDILARLPFFRGLAFRQASLAIADCKYTINRMPEFHRKLPPIGLLYDPVDVAFFRPFAKSEARAHVERRFATGTLDQRFIVITVASLLLPPNKGHRQTIDALVQLHDPRYLYLVVGDGPDRDAIAAYAAERGVSGQVRMLGFVDQEDLPLLYSAADVAVLVARGSDGLGEAVPLGLIEAAACGVPFVCGNQDGSPEAISEARPNGIAIDPDRPEALAAALRQLAERPALAKAMGENGKWMVDEMFRFEKFTDRFAHLMWRHLGVARLPAAGPTLATSPRG